MNDHDVDYKWYVVKTHSGKEFRVKEFLEKAVEREGMKTIKEAVVPVYKEVVYKDGKKREVQRKSFPGYIYVHMALGIDQRTDAKGEVVKEITEDGKRTMAFVKEIPYVASFVYQRNDENAFPRALSNSEVQNMVLDADDADLEVVSPQMDFDVGQKVLVIDGPFNNFSGTVKEVYPDKRKVCVNIMIFGRTTPVEIDYFKVKRN